MDAWTSCIAQRTRAKMGKRWADDREMKKEKSNAFDAVKRKGEVEILADCRDRMEKVKSKRSNATSAVKRKKGDEEKEEELNLKRKRRKVKGDPIGLDDDEGSDSDVQIDGSKRDPSGFDDDERSDSGDHIVSEVSVPPSDGSKSDPSGFNDDEGTGIDVQIVKEESFPGRGRRGRSDGNRITRSRRARSDKNRNTDRINSEESGRAQLRTGAIKGEMIFENSGSSNSDFSSSGEEENDSDDNDYEEEESGSSDALSDGSSCCSDDGIEGAEEKDDCNISPVERCYEERDDYDDDEGNIRKTNLDATENSVVENAREEHVRGIEDGFKRIIAHGLDILVDLHKEDDEKQQRRSIRLRPRSVPESEKKNLRLGTYSQPLRVHENEDCDSSDEDGVYSDPVAKSSKRSYKKVEKLSKKSAHQSKVVDIKNAIDVLVSSILGEGEALSDILAPNEEKAGTQKVLALKFEFEDEDPAPPEKEEWQIEIDNLFAELEMGLTMFDTDANISSRTQNINVNAKANSPAERCLLGDHQLILEEPTGIICKCCRLVCVEMKDIFPDLIVPTSQKRDSFYCGSGGCSTSDEIDIDGSACENYSATVPTEGSVLDLIPSNTRMSMYHHQLDGFVFLWKNVVGETSIEKLKSHSLTEGSGCIISHAPGTGKTCLSVVFILSLMKIYPTCRPVIVAPRSMLLTWKQEFEKWGLGIPFHNLNSQELPGKENEVAAGLEHLVTRVRNGKQDRRRFIRIAKLYSWAQHRSVLGVSYHLFEKLVNGPEKERNDEKVRKILLELPGLLVLDEGHTPRNKRSQIWKAMTKVETRRRIILSGTPFQNTLDELYNTLSLVNPEVSKANLRLNSLTDAIDRRNEKSVAKLKAMIDPFVHVHKGTILQERLPGLKDMLVILRPTNQQKTALQLISDVGKQFDKVHSVPLVSVHPSLAAKKKFLVHKSELGLLDSSPSAGVKTKFVMELVKLCQALNEKVLIFSEYIDPLQFIKQQLEDQFSWIEGKEVLYMDGKQDAKHRQSSIDALNAPASEVKVFLASTRACSEGINLVGASRVVLLDVVWNPSVERQAISRAYRLGQTKIVYVYHLITTGTLEVDKYAQQIKKHRLSELVFCCGDGENKREKISAAVAEDKILELMIDDKNMKDMFEDIVHNPKESTLFENFNFVSELKS